jgi:hypothetical protein
MGIPGFLWLVSWRDGIYLIYGQINSDENRDFINNLSKCFKVAFLIAISFIHTTSLRRYTKQFIDDVNLNLRGINLLNDADKFWNAL